MFGKKYKKEIESLKEQLEKSQEEAKQLKILCAVLKRKLTMAKKQLNEVETELADRTVVIDNTPSTIHKSKK